MIGKSYKDAFEMNWSGFASFLGCRPCRRPPGASRGLPPGASGHFLLSRYDCRGDLGEIFIYIYRRRTLNFE